MNIKRSIEKRINYFFKFNKIKKEENLIVNYYRTNYSKNVLISYITYPFKNDCNYYHQNYFTAHLIAESFSGRGYNVDIIDFNDELSLLDYNKYSIVFGFGHNLENSFY